MALMLALAPGRERIVLPHDGYYGGRVLADRLRPHGAVPVPVDLQDLAAVDEVVPVEVESLREQAVSATKITATETTAANTARQRVSSVATV